MTKKKVITSGFVYIWLDKKHKRFYIGSHWGFPTDKYICSSTWMRDAYKRRPEDFKRRILETVHTTRDDLYELALIQDEKLGKRYYNLKKDRHVGVFDGTTKAERISNSLKGKKHNPEHTAKRAASIKKTMSTPEKKLELSLQAQVIWATPGHQEARVSAIATSLNKPEVKQKISETSTKLWQDPDYRALQTEKHIGIILPPRTEEQIEVNRLAQLNLWSDLDHAKKMSDAHLNSEVAMESSRANIKKTHTVEARAKAEETKKAKREDPAYEIAYKQMMKEKAMLGAMKRWHPEQFVFV